MRHFPSAKKRCSPAPRRRSIGVYGADCPVFAIREPYHRIRHSRTHTHCARFLHRVVRVRVSTAAEAMCHMRIAVATEGSHVATVFDFARTLTVVDRAEGRITGENLVAFPETLPSIRAEALKNLGVDTLICGAISNPVAAMLSHSGINLVPGITGDTKRVLAAYLGGNLHRGNQFLLPGLGPSGRCGWGARRPRRFRRRGRGR